MSEAEKTVPAAGKDARPWYRRPKFIVKLGVVAAAAAAPAVAKALGYDLPPELVDFLATLSGVQ